MYICIIFKSAYVSWPQRLCGIIALDLVLQDYVGADRLTPRDLESSKSLSNKIIRVIDVIRTDLCGKVAKIGSPGSFK